MEKMVVFRPKTTHQQLWIIQLTDVMLYLNPTLILNSGGRYQF